MNHYDNIKKTSSIPLVKAGTSLKKSYKKNSALNKVIKNPIIQGAIKSLVGKNPLLAHHFLHIQLTMLCGMCSICVRIQYIS